MRTNSGLGLAAVAIMTIMAHQLNLRGVSPEFTIFGVMLWGAALAAIAAHRDTVDWWIVPTFVTGVGALYLLTVFIAAPIIDGGFQEFWWLLMSPFSLGIYLIIAVCWAVARFVLWRSDRAAEDRRSRSTLVMPHTLSRG